MAIGSAGQLFFSRTVQPGRGGWLVELETGPCIIGGQRSNLQWESYDLYGP